ncbi:Uncharacterized protein OS=Singulisphaera acidiphila (strain ATCC BAA-1392 / DSM 18658 / VKM B-2454 / MOB10) GN=Sinac_3783 PE=4 SV=1 [Gemmata massiliana]|uniref:ABC-2 type transport system permease protein n=1 Tax=Gemmata massiliana TaxID=1210884 RepID=A0A6P2D1A1_9BACT|nr:CrcB family protein [Gemmata massiliana]VTR93864.1 Uncharacterized protein OS=Singulisphaera acidiphila (strain ATCC BAA-1392 / DSM 18658 / VKM B-2454 / MOB10) GN=Sinac_3783 PE=4 SV=1 [Gemmata massiliana]
MNREHLSAFLWLRWRLRYNQFRKAGPLNAVLFVVFVVSTLIAAVGVLITGFLVGLFVLPQASPTVRLLVWDGIVGAFLFFWMIGLLTELQRTEGLALDKVMHLPVSPSGAFVINYVSSLFSLTLITFVPAMFGLIIGDVCAGSVSMLLALPLLAAFVLAVTGVTYQFQGWLASLMANPRRRRAIIVGITTGFVILAQLPNMFVTRPWSGAPKNDAKSDAVSQLNDQRAAASADLATRKITQEQYQQREKEIQQEFQDRQTRESQQKLEQTESIARFASTVIPPGWLALGAAELAAGSVLPALLGTLGLGAIGFASLRRAYRTTLRLYSGEFTGQGRQAPAVPTAPIDPSRVRLLERSIPWVSEQASVVAITTFRSLIRAPEVKMVLIAPFIMLVVFGGSAVSAKAEIPAAVRPLIALGSGIAVLFLCGVQLIGNQFGFDRSGFRAYVLSPAPRREILLGKNLALAPFGVGMGLIVVLIMGIAYPMRIDHYPAVAAQLVTAYLLLCLLANALSILSPIRMAAGSMQPSRVKMLPVLLQMAFLAVLPVVLLPVAIPLGVELLLAELSEIRGWPVSLVLSILGLGIAALAYRAVLSSEGRWLALREKAILEIVTHKEE